MAGKSNLVTNCLSCAVVSPVYVDIDFSALAADKHGDLDILRLQSEPTSLKLKERQVQEGSPSLLCDVLTGCPHPQVPAL